MIDTAYLIRRIRQQLNQTPFLSESTTTNADTRFSSRGKLFSDNDLTERICDILERLLRDVDVIHFEHGIGSGGSVVERYTGGWPELPDRTRRVLENRVFIAGERATRIAQQSARALSESCREATTEFPAYTLGEGWLRGFPQDPDYADIVVGPDVGDTVSAHPQLIPAIIHGVCSSCNQSLSEEGIDITERRELARWHEIQYEKCIVPFSLKTRSTSYRDQEGHTERNTQ